ncbi:hypothetical protein NVP1199A_68 [Vibrio phage 1.199.A._10N.286.55.C10]|nr:hypothetical protein NVP1007O_71 [Vibrio phage 1.007.O._10N.261.55.F9]AUR92551.1 hypothetical protein NVP1173O_75 [Vibrio phage 1.173.O._10N.261.55.A11]AUR94934.1 hypothetical protein NVP1199A_68 [Vibrio phage 1.199.A._10N.286.55.C10]AUR95011.1 hypothetical protein NVP1199B_68 [Vibrio phage 1.199.B._10N.286.55.C10]
MALIKYQCHTVGSALDLVAYVSDRGGNVCVVMNGFNATRTVLTDYPFSNKDDEEAARHAWHTSEPSEWDKQYFDNAMK